MSTDERIASLQSKHADLERRIDELQARPNPDEAIIGEFKREKLRIKDEISRLES